MHKRKKIIFINQSTGYLFIDIINSFTATYKCELYTGRIDDTQTKIDPLVKIHSLVSYSRNTAIKRIFTWVLFTLQAFFKLLFVNKNAELFLVTNPPFTPFLGYFFYKLKGIKYHLLIYDVYPNVLVNFNLIKSNGLIDRSWSNLNSKLFESAETIFTISEGMAHAIKGYCRAKNVIVIPNWTNTAYIKPVEKLQNPFAIMHDQLNKLTIMYSGNMGITHNIEKIAELAFVFKLDKSWGFILIGNGPKKNIISKIKDENVLDNLILLDYQTPDILPYSLACADVGIVTIGLGAEDASVPSKTYNLLAAGVALLVIAPNSSEVAKLVKYYNCGRQFEEDQIEAMVGFLNEIKANPNLLHEMKNNARKASYDFTSANADLYATVINNANVQ